MRLTTNDTITDAEWALAADVRAVTRLGGPLSLRERQLARVCGSEARALQVLAAVARAERTLDQLLAVPARAPEFTIRPVPRRASVGSSGTPARAGRTATAPARAEIAAALVCAAGLAASAAHAFAGAR